MMMRKIFLLLCTGFIFFSLPIGILWSEGGVAMKISSPDFQDNGYIPRRLTCDEDGVSPALIIEGVPGEARSLALVVDDPDAPAGTFVHWVVFDIPLVSKIEENSIPGKQGKNTTGKQNYASPCPPSGTHRYFFKLYALDTVLNLEAGVSKGALEKAMQGHILEKAQLIGLCQRKR
jgi:hypothetical protein